MTGDDVWLNGVAGILVQTLAMLCVSKEMCVCVCERERERVKRGHREVSYLVKNLSNKPPMMVRCPIVLQWQQAP
jgi:hypothetical protein